MTPEQTKAAIAVMQAYVDGKKVQYKHRGSGVWILANDVDPNWLFEYFDYRIAPEPKYRPYNSPSEVPIGQWVRHKGTGVDFVLFRVIEHGLIPGQVRIKTAHPTIFGTWYTAADLLRDYELLDGKPCGILEGAQQ